MNLSRPRRRFPPVAWLGSFLDGAGRGFLTTRVALGLGWPGYPSRLSIAGIGCFLLLTSTALAGPIIVPGQGVADDRGGYPRFGPDYAITLTATSTTSGSANLSPGVYSIVCTEDAYVDQGTTGVVAAAGERIIPADERYRVRVDGYGDTYFAFVRVTADGSCSISEDEY